MDPKATAKPTPSRKRNRLSGFDYSQAGAYFVTIVARNRACVFGEVVGGKMALNPAGKMVDTAWCEFPEHYPGVNVDWHIVMPNHLHGIVVLAIGTNDAVGAGPGARPKSSTHATGRPQGVAPTLGLSDVVHRFKTFTTTTYIRRVASEGWSPFSRGLWQRLYYDHIIRDEEDLGRAREYIANNPARWADDEENADNARTHGGQSPSRHGNFKTAAGRSLENSKFSW